MHCFYALFLELNFRQSILIVLAITISYDGNFYVSLEFFYRFPVCISHIFLFVGSSMDSDETGSCLFKRLSKLDELFCTIAAESGFYRDGNREIFSEDIDDFHSTISVDHESWTVSTLHHFLCRTPHIDIDSLRPIGLDDFPSREKYLRSISKYLKDERVLYRIMSENSLGEKGIVMEAVSTIEFAEYDNVWSDCMANCSESTVTVSIHWCEGDYGFICGCERVYPIHGFIFFSYQ